MEGKVTQSPIRKRKSSRVAGGSQLSSFRPFQPQWHGMGMLHFRGTDYRMCMCHATLLVTDIVLQLPEPEQRHRWDLIRATIRSLGGICPFA